MKVSIIIPIYNSEKYLKRCIDSVISQTYKNLEIILVNDGSTDNSVNICNEYVKQDSRIKLISKENGGLSSARNKGLEYVTGDYVFYLDSDDYLSKKCIETLVKYIIKYDADISIIKMMYISENTNEEMQNDTKNDIMVMDSEKAIEESLYQRKYSCCAPAKLYKTEIAKEIEFPLGKLSEDLATCHKFLDKANKIVYTSEIGYYYRQHGSSIMHKFNIKRMDALDWAIEIENFCKEKYPKIIKAAKNRTFNVAIHLLLDIQKETENYDRLYKTIWYNIKRTRKSVLFNKNVRLREKAAAILSYGGAKLLKRAWNSKIAIKRKEN